MIHAFLFLISRSFVNRTKARLKRLKKPKYLIGAIFGVVYLYSYFFQFLFFRGRGAARADVGVDDSLLPLIGVVVLFLMIVSAWIFPHARAALVFSEAEIAFLFPAPIGRRTLIHFKLLRSQIAILFTVLLLTLLTGRVFANSHAWMRVLGWWVILSTLSLHFLGASFARTMLMERGISNWMRRTVVLVFLAGLIGGTFLWARETLPLPAIDNFMDWKAWRDYGRDVLATAPLSYVMYPFQLVLAPYLARTPLDFGHALLPALAILTLHYLWVIRSNVAFEEASLAASQRFAERVAAARQGKALEAVPRKGRRAPFRLQPIGPLPMAFLWKNLIAAQATFRPRTILLILIPVFMMGVMAANSGPRGTMLISVVSLMAFMVFTWSLFIGAQFVRCDFRKDLATMDVIKLYPLPGWQIAAGELLAPLTILTAVQWILLTLGLILMALGGTPAGFPEVPLSWIAAALIITPFWNGLTLIIPNAAVLLLPGWFQTRVDTPQGIEVAGQRLLLLFGQLFVFGIAVLPAGLAFALGFFPLQFLGAETFAPVTGAIGAAVALALEMALGVWMIGKLFDRFDLAGEP